MTAIVAPLALHSEEEGLASPTPGADAQDVNSSLHSTTSEPQMSTAARAIPAS